MREANSTKMMNFMQLILLQYEVQENGYMVCILGWIFFSFYHLKARLCLYGDLLQSTVHESFMILLTSSLFPSALLNHVIHGLSALVHTYKLSIHRVPTIYSFISFM